PNSGLSLGIPCLFKHCYRMAFRQMLTPLLFHTVSNIFRRILTPLVFKGALRFRKMLPPCLGADFGFTFGKMILPNGRKNQTHESDKTDDQAAPTGLCHQSNSPQSQYK
ncbi:hypothetical protein, partial [Sphingobacterium siyangense]|uniref:hypothetical protein n=1 Tax=Sphingobacterium siyangense TaxID=459529 RepID=UPI003DA41733